MPDPDLVLATKIATVHQRLGDVYGVRAWHKQAEPIDQLVTTILSQNTSDVNTHRSFQALKQAYPDWTQAMNAPQHELIEVIRSGGLANQKGPRIQNTLLQIYAEQGDFDLNWLEDVLVNEARAWLTQFKGVGNKTASILLLFCFNRPAFAVDTHVQRLSRRLGIAPANANADTVMHVLEEYAAPEWYYPLHINFIRHGRALCKARKPQCESCTLGDLCDWYQKDRKPVDRVC